jgi:divalent metal cation (Fe/Co/Zn/Cd) transporter
VAGAAVGAVVLRTGISVGWSSLKQLVDVIFLVLA